MLEKVIKLGHKNLIEKIAGCFSPLIFSCVCIFWNLNFLHPVGQPGGVFFGKKLQETVSPDKKVLPQKCLSGSILGAALFF